MADFFSSRLLRWLTAPARSRVVNFASKPFYTVADRILGTQFLQDIAEFFLLFQSMYDGFVERAKAVERVLHDRRTTFVVVSTLESAPVREAEFFIEELRGPQAPPRRRRAQQGAAGEPARHAGARPSPAGSRTEAPSVAAEAVAAASIGADDDQVARVLREVGAELPELPGRGPAGGRDPGRAGAPPPRSWRRRRTSTATSFDLGGLVRLGDAIWR